MGECKNSPNCDNVRSERRMAMTDTITVALISGICVVASSLITGAISKNQFSMELDKKIAVIQTDIKYITDDIKSLTTEVRVHNNFAVRVPMIEERVKEIEKEIE